MVMEVVVRIECAKDKMEHGNKRRKGKFTQVQMGKSSICSPFIMVNFISCKSLANDSVHYDAEQCVC